jgi:predicted MFS family arabinose efflux permease
MTMVETAAIAGVAPGAAIAGRVIDAHGASAAYLVSLVAGLVAALSALAARDEPACAPDSADDPGPLPHAP